MLSFRRCWCTSDAGLVIRSDALDRRQELAVFKQSYWQYRSLQAAYAFGSLGCRVADVTCYGSTEIVYMTSGIRV